MLRIQLGHREYSKKKKIRKGKRSFYITKKRKNRNTQNHATQEIHSTEKNMANICSVLLRTEKKSFITAVLFLITNDFYIDLRDAKAN